MHAVVSARAQQLAESGRTGIRCAARRGPRGPPSPAVLAPRRCARPSSWPPADPPRLRVTTASVRPGWWPGPSKSSPTGAGRVSPERGDSSSTEGGIGRPRWRCCRHADRDPLARARERARRGPCTDPHRPGADGHPAAPAPTGRAAPDRSHEPGGRGRDLTPARRPSALPLAGADRPGYAGADPAWRRPAAAPDQVSRQSRWWQATR